MKRVGVLIGDVCASREALMMRTVLGSCVSACLFDPVAGVGGMNHFMLPGEGDDDHLPSRFGVNAMEMLINEMMKLQGDRRRLQAKVFGGASVLQMTDPLLQVGERNADFVRQFLEVERIPVVSHCLGGTRPLEVRFFTGTAKAMVRPVPQQSLDAIWAIEKRYCTALMTRLARPEFQDVTLF